MATDPTLTQFNQAMKTTQTANAYAAANPQPTTSGNMMGTISLDQMKPTSQMQNPSTPTDSTNYTGITGSVTDSILNNYNTVNKQYQDMLTKQTSGAQSMTDIMTKLLNKEADKQAANETTGVNKETENLNKYVQQLADLNAQSSALNREAQAIPIQIQNEVAGQGVTDAGIAPITSARLRDNALKALSIGQQSDIAYAAATGSQLRLNAAKDKAQQIVDLKYKPLEDELKFRQDQYKLNKDFLDEYDKKRSESLQVVLKKEADALAEKKQKEKENNDLILNAQIQNAPANLVSKAMQVAKNGGTKNEVAQALGIYAGDVLDRQIKQAQLQKLGLDIKKAKLDFTGDGSGLKQLSYEDNARFNGTPQVKDTRDAMSYAKAVSDYKSAINKYGTGEVWNGTGAGQLSQAYSALVGATKDYYKLGTLDNGVQKLIDLGISEPGFMVRQSKQIGALDQALSSAKSTITTNMNQLASTKYSGSMEYQTLADEIAKNQMSGMTLNDLLNQLPSSQPSGDTSSFWSNFNNTTTKATAF